MTANDTPASTFRYNEKPTYTTSSGAPIDNPSGWQRPGTLGPLLLQDFHLIDALAHFDRMFYPSCFRIKKPFRGRTPLLPKL